MTVNELIGVLSTMPPDMRVYSRNRHNGSFAYPSITVRVSSRMGAVAIEGSANCYVDHFPYLVWLEGEKEMRETKHILDNMLDGDIY
jgi:hypothetical protein